MLLSRESLARLGVSSDPQGQIPSTDIPKLPQAEVNYDDGSETLFSLYNEKTLEFDSKHIENWREDANSLVILVSHPLRFIKHISGLTGSLYDRAVWSQRPSQDSWHSLIFHFKQTLKMSRPSTSLRFITFSFI